MKPFYKTNGMSLFRNGNKAVPSGVDVLSSPAMLTLLRRGKTISSAGGGN